MSTKLSHKKFSKRFHINEKIILKEVQSDGADFTEEECDKLVRKLKSLRQAKGKVFRAPRRALSHLDKLMRAK